MQPEHEAWLARRSEPALAPDVRIVDPHHHLSDRPDDRYVVDDLHADTGSGHHVEQTVFVECMAGYRESGPEHLRPVGETEFVVRQAEEAVAAGGARIGGIVGFADLLLGAAVEEVLAAHVDAGAGLFRGIRHASAFDPSPDIRRTHTNPPPGLLGLGAFREGFATLAGMGLSFDAYLYHPQIPELTDLARALPDAVIVLDHIGAPLDTGPYVGHRAEVLDGWRRSMAELATCTNVVLKVGGIGMPWYGGRWRDRPDPPTSEELAAYWGPELRWCIETFGPERCMFESNFPVDKRSCSYVVLWNTFKRVAAGASPSEEAALFRETAIRAYALAPAA